MSATTNSQSISMPSTGTVNISASSDNSITTAPQMTIFLDQTTLTTIEEHNSHSHPHHHHNNHQQTPHHHELIQAEETKGTSPNDETYQISTMQPVANGDVQTQSYVIETSPHMHGSTTITTIDGSSSATLDQNHFQNIETQLSAPSEEITIKCDSLEQEPQQQSHQNQLPQSNSPATRFKWTNEKTQVAMNLVKYGCKPKLVSVAVGCSLRTAQKFVETVTPKIEGETFKTYEIKRRGRKSKDVNQRLNAIREVLSRDSNKTQVEIAADLKVSNTTVCRDLKRIGASWKEKKHGNNGGDILTNGTNQPESALTTNTTRKTRQSSSKSRNKPN